MKTAEEIFHNHPALAHISLGTATGNIIIKIMEEYADYSNTQLNAVTKSAKKVLIENDELKECLEELINLEAKHKYYAFIIYGKEDYIKLINTAKSLLNTSPTNKTSREEEVKELYLALVEAKEIISIMWHSGKKQGNELWDFYQYSPEMKRINSPLDKYRYLKLNSQ